MAIRTGRAETFRRRARAEGTRRRVLLPLALCACFALSCTGLYYDAQERILGKQKRHILKERVQAGQRDQLEAQEQFQTTLDLFKEVTRFDGGDLEKFYKRLQGEYDDSERRAQDVRDRIDSIERVASDLFAEWRQEIDLIENASLRRESQAGLRSTESRYERYLAAMHRAEATMDPVLIAFRDQVLYLKHNLNARAIDSLDRNADDIESDVETLIADMRQAMREAEDFLSAMES